MPSGGPAQSTELSPVQLGLGTSDQLADTLSNSVSFWPDFLPLKFRLIYRRLFSSFPPTLVFVIFPSETEVGKFDSRELLENVLPQVLDIAPACF